MTIELKCITFVGERIKKQMHMKSNESEMW